MDLESRKSRKRLLRSTHSREQKEFLDELRSFSQVILISDTFTEFAQPLMEKLGRPTLFCNSLEIAENGEITDFKMRVENSKLSTVKALQSIGFETIASGDSYNDLGMIQAGKAGFLFRTTDKIKRRSSGDSGIRDICGIVGSYKIGNWDLIQGRLWIRTGIKLGKVFLFKFHRRVNSKGQNSAKSRLSEFETRHTPQTVKF